MSGQSEGLRVYGKDVEKFIGSITGGGASDGTVASGGTLSIASLAIDGTGQYTLTTRENWSTFHGFIGFVRGSSGYANAKLARCTGYNATAKTVSVEIIDINGGALANLATTDTLDVEVTVGRTANV